MSVLIKGVEMPKDGELLCINIHPDGKVCINLDLECEKVGEAVHVPSHGDLIDRDGAVRDLRIDYAYAAAKIVALQPVIIPASGGNEDE